MIVQPADLTLRDALRVAAIFAAAKLVLQFALTRGQRTSDTATSVMSFIT